MKQFKIGVIYTQSPLTDVARWYSLLSNVGDVRLVLPHERSMQYDCILIPDAGVNTNTNTFKTKGFIAMGNTPICPFVEMFRIESLEYYVSNEVPIITVGQSRALITELCELKCWLNKGIPVILKPDNPVVDILERDLFIEDFQYNNLNGVSSINSSNLLPILRDIKMQTINGEMDGSQLVTVKAPIPSNPLKAAEANPLPKNEEEGW